jgi:hypothetical protein
MRWLLVVVHDLDRANEKLLRGELEKSIKDIGFVGKIVLIPIEELEAWLLVDAHALQTCFSMDAEPRVPRNPQSVASPKEYLRDLVWRCSKKRYVNTIHNKKIAALINIQKLKVCTSFIPFPPFIALHLPPQVGHSKGS